MSKYKNSKYKKYTETEEKNNLHVQKTQLVSSRPVGGALTATAFKTHQIWCSFITFNTVCNSCNQSAATGHVTKTTEVS